jgi:hypothetical protein
MAHRLAFGAEVELDEIWLWTAKESGSVICGVFPWGNM